MSRIEFGMEAGGQDQLQRLVRNQLGRICADLVTTSQAPEEVSRIVIVGNTVMHHLFSGITVEPLSHFPSNRLK
jgi:uncharacterized 2Fe-2S/4Fe-4S cluster protein (DUF4445 family)